MRPLRATWVRLHALFHKQRLDREFNNELAAHLDLHVADNLRAGMSPAEARRDALQRLGGIEQTRENHRDVRGFPLLESVVQDLRYGLRTLASSPGFTAVAVLTLALGIGATAAIFGLVNGILLVSLPYPDPEQLVSVTGTYPKGAVVAMRQQVRSADVAAYHEGAEFNLTGQGEPVRLTGTLVSAELFSILGARPEVGRTFVTGEDVASQDRYVVLSHALWQQRFGGQSSIIGRYIELEGVSRQVVGVMPADFRFPSPRTQVWIPLDNDPRNPVLYWADDFMPVLGRLRPGATVDQARAEIRAFQSRVEELFPWPMPASWNAEVSVVPLQDGMVSDVRTRLLVLLAAVLFVVLIACANVANLTLARAATREKEVSVRAALGAVPRRIARQVLTESVLVATLGAALGILFATQGLALLKTWLPADTPRLAEAQVDWRVLLFTGALTILTGFASGLAPALQSLRTSATQALAPAVAMVPFPCLGVCGEHW
jgi:predicted permease